MGVSPSAERKGEGAGMRLIVERADRVGALNSLIKGATTAAERSLKTRRRKGRPNEKL